MELVMVACIKSKGIWIVLIHSLKVFADWEILGDTELLVFIICKKNWERMKLLTAVLILISLGGSFKLDFHSALDFLTSPFL